MGDFNRHDVLERSLHHNFLMSLLRFLNPVYSVAIT